MLSLFLMKLQAWRPAILLKTDFNTGVFKETYFEEQLRAADSGRFFHESINVSVNNTIHASCE